MQVNNKGNTAKEMDSQRAKCRPEQKKWAQLHVHNLVTFIRTSGNWGSKSQNLKKPLHVTKNMEEGGGLWVKCLRLRAQSALVINTFNVNIKKIL